MAWDLTTAKAYLKITDNTHDAAITLTMDSVIAAVETILGRGILFKRQIEQFYDVTSRKVFLSRYPIKQLIRINGSPPSKATLVHHRVGWVEVDPMDWSNGMAAGSHGRTITFEYDGGFNPLPSDLEAVLWEAFVTKWADVDPLTGGPVPGGSTVITGSGDVSRVTIADFGSVSFDVGSSVVGGGTSGLAANQGVWGWLAPWAYILNTYRSEAAPSLAFA